MTTTTRPAAVTAPASASPIESLTPLAGIELPAQVLLHASRFCRNDPNHPSLQGVRLQWQPTTCGDGTLTIAAVDGHRAMRVRIPSSSKLLGDWAPDHPFQAVIDGQILRKITAKASRAMVNTGGTQIVLLDRKLNVLSMLPCQGPADYRHGSFSFPNLDQLWPESFTNEPKNTVGINAVYMKEVLDSIAKLSTNGIARMRFNTPTTPIVFEGTYDDDHDINLEFMVMPVQIKSAQ